MAKVLIVDDDEVLRRMYSAKLSHDGYEVVTCADGNEVLNLVTQERPDIVLLDIMLPHKDGLTLLGEIKNNPQSQQIPVVMMTNLAGDETKQSQAMSLGAAAFLVKTSVTPQEIVAKLKEVLSVKQN